MAFLSERERHPELFQKDLNIDRRTCKRVVPMQVLALGMSRTGTASMQMALQILGYNETYHGFALLANFRDAEMWLEALDAKYNPQNGLKPFGRAEWDQLLGHCAAVCDMPCAVFGPELVDAYPEAKVVLVERDIESWYKSFRDSICLPVFNPFVKTMMRLDTKFLGKTLALLNVILKGRFNTTDLASLDKNARAGYRAHYKEIRDATPKDRLLDFKLAQGWEPLCKFLGKPIPDCPFPRVNDQAAAQEKLFILLRMLALDKLKQGLIILSVIGSLYFLVRRFFL